MKKIYYILSALFLCVVATSAQEAGKTVVIKTNVGTMKAILYDDVPNHTRTFIERAKRGDFNGTLFTRVLPEFMIQGGAPDSKNAPAGAKCGFGDPSAEILPEINEKYFHKKGALAAPRQPDDVNPQKKSDMSQFFIVQGKVYRETELDTLERTANYPARQKALKEFYAPVRAELNMIKMSNKRECPRHCASGTAPRAFLSQEAIQKIHALSVILFSSCGSPHQYVFGCIAGTPLLAPAFSADCP